VRQLVLLLFFCLLPQKAFQLLNDFILVFNHALRVFFFPVLGTSDITEAYEVGDRRHAYMFFTVVAL
jgi:hypothetical protein